MIELTGFQLFELFSDFNLILKLFALLMIMSFVFNHLGKGPMAWIVMAIIAYFVMFDSWKFFGPVYVLYMLMAMGFTGFIIDYFFMAQPLRTKPQSHAGTELEGPNSMDAKSRQDMLHKAQQHGGQKAPPPMMG